jgi:hypothetical protein
MNRYYRRLKGALNLTRRTIQDRLLRNSLDLAVKSAEGIACMYIWRESSHSQVSLPVPCMAPHLGLIPLDTKPLL